MQILKAKVFYFLDDIGSDMGCFSIVPASHTWPEDPPGEYRHELESDIEPFKGLLLGLFFISVGASIDFGLVASQAGLLAGLVAALVLLKFACPASSNSTAPGVCCCSSPWPRAASSPSSCSR